MSQVVVIGTADTTFSAHCDLCGTAFAGRLDPDLQEGMFLCREGHRVRIVRGQDPFEESHAAASAA
jgi:hypothetical protein